MAGFLYFKPNHLEPRVTLPQLREWGLAYAFDSPPATREVNFPAVGKGTLFADESRLDGRSLGHYQAEQTWRKIPASDCWVGFYTEARPKPEQLVRADQYRGYNVTLQDDNQWAIPLVVQALEGEPISNLPCKLNVDDEGKICDGDPIEKYRYLWELTEPYADAFLHGTKGIEELDSNDVLRDAVALLAVNYRLGLAEVILLDLFTASITELPLAVCLAAIDYPEWAKWQEQLKKTKSPAETDGSNIAVGNTDSQPATVQPALNS